MYSAASMAPDLQKGLPGCTAIAPGTEGTWGTVAEEAVTAPPAGITGSDAGKTCVLTKLLSCGRVCCPPGTKGVLCCPPERLWSAPKTGMLPQHD